MEEAGLMGPTRASRDALREEGLRLGGDGVVLDVSEGKVCRNLP